MSKQFREQQINAGHTVEIGEEHLDINGETVRTVMYRSKNFVKPEVVESTVDSSTEVDQILHDLAVAEKSKETGLELLKEGETNEKHV
jgi:hypothetical protein